MSNKEEKILVYWNISCVNTKTKKLFDRNLILDLQSLAPAETKDILEILKHSSSYSKILKYRRTFHEALPGFLDDIAKDFSSFNSIYIPDYFEDEAGNEVNQIGLMRHLSGQQTPIILGNVNSILQLGPSSLKNKLNWKQEHSDILAHFLQVHSQIAKSRWLKEDCKLTHDGNKLSSKVPSFESLIYVAIYFRQLYSQKDKLFRSACDAYIRFVDNDEKLSWVKNERDSFSKKLEECPLFCDIDGIKNKDLIEAFLYGALVLHSNLNVKPFKKDNFKKLLDSLGRIKFVFCLNSCLRLLYNNISTVAPLIEHDFAYWQNNEGIPAPDIYWHSKIFGEQN